MSSDPLVERMREFGTTIFTEMSALAVRTGSINLGQGFPDTDGPPEMLAAAAEALRSGANHRGPGFPGRGGPPGDVAPRGGGAAAGANQTPATARHPGAAGRDRRARGAVLGSFPRPGRRGRGHRGRDRGGGGGNPRA